jgi:hypothetical protein
MTAGYPQNYPQNYPHGPTPPPPFGHFPHAPPPPKSRKRLVWILVGVGGLATVLCCGGFGLLAYFGFGIISTEVRNQVRDHPVVVEYIGEIESFEMSFTESAATNDDETFVYEIKGTKGTGVLTAKHVTNDDGSEEILWAKLRLPNGQQHHLIMPGPE